MSDPVGSPTSTSPLQNRRVKKPSGPPLQLFPTSYVDLDLDSGSPSEAASNESSPQLPLSPLTSAVTPPGSASFRPSHFEHHNPASTQHLLPPHPQSATTYYSGTSPISTPPSSSYSPPGGGFALQDAASAPYYFQQQSQHAQHPQQQPHHLQPPHSQSHPSYFLPQQPQPQHQQPHDLYPHPQQQHQPQIPQQQQQQTQAPPQFYSVPGGGAGAAGAAGSTSRGEATSENSGPLPVLDAFAGSAPQQQQQLGLDYQPIFEDDVPAPHHGDQPKKQRGKHEEDEDDYMGLYNKPKPSRPAAAPAMMPAQPAGRGDSALTSLFATSASSLRQRRGGDFGEDVSSASSDQGRGLGQAPPAAASAGGGRKRLPSASNARGGWHWPWASRLAGVLLLGYFISLAYRHFEKDGFEGLVDTVFNLQIFILLAALGMLVLSPTLIDTSLVVLSYYHFSWWADVVHWLATGAFYFGTAVPIASISWNDPEYYTIADLSYHALFLPLCFLALYKNGGVRWRAGFLSVFLHSLLFLLSTTHPLPVPSLQGYAPFAYRTANSYEQAYKSENSPPYRTFMAHAPQHLQQAADSLVPLLEQQGLHVGLDRAAPEQGGGIIVPSYVYSILWIALCNLVAFVLLKVLSFVLLQRGAQQGKKKKAE